MQYNWALDIALDSAGDQSLIVQGLESFDGFTVDMGEIELSTGNEKRYVSGKATFQESTLVLKDFVDAGVAEAMNRWFTEVYNARTGSVGLAANYKKQADLTITSPDNGQARIWKFIGMWPKSFKHGPFDMTSEDKAVIECVMRFDKVIPGTGFNNGLGSINVGSTTIALP